MEKISKINPEILNSEDIRKYFEKEVGEGVGVGESVVFEINK